MTDTETSTYIIEKLELTKKYLETEIKNLTKSINDQMNSGNNQGKKILDGLLENLNETINSLKSNLDQSVRESQTQNTEQLLSLKESLNGQINSLKGYADSLVEDEELRLVSNLETSMENVGDINKQHSSKISGMVEKIASITKVSIKAPIDIAEKNNMALKETLNDALKMERKILSKSLESLQTEFRDEIGLQIERVFMGVTVTKETLNGIIQDTLSRLEENLRRLNEGIDENFTSEIGRAQDLIHEYEGKLLTTLEETKSNYDVAMEKIIEKNATTHVNALNELKDQLTNKENELLVEINELDTEQQEVLQASLNEFENHIGKSKAQVIESQGILKDELEKLLKENTESIKEIIDTMKVNSQEQTKSMQNTIDTQVRQLTKESNTMIKERKIEVESLLDQIKNDSLGNIDRAGKEMGQQIEGIYREEKQK
ncbi:MAG: hypothetical protein GPJ54_22170 [Candidatus Heimdallarchaeota archaeon]|nr:hypothetical protein [Candidatus Heimdallarchaeota archaeon]